MSVWKRAALVALAAGSLAAAPAIAQEPAFLRVVVGSAERPVAFHFAPADSAIVARLADAVAGFVPEPVESLGIPADTIDVIVAPSEPAFREATGGRAPDWGLAVAFPRIGRVVMRSPRLTGDAAVDPAVVLRHELGHVYLGAALGERGDPLPRWFHEGFAALYADEWRWVDPYRLAWARITGTLQPLSELHDTIPDVGDPSVAYVQSMAAVRALERRGGDPALGLLLGRLRDGATFDAALRETYGLTLDQFYAEWESDLGRQYGWAVALSGQEGLWIVLAVIVLLLFGWRRRAMKREIRRRMRREDQALGPPGDHRLGAEEWERYWEWEDEEWKGEEEER